MPNCVDAESNSGTETCTRCTATILLKADNTCDENTTLNDCLDFRVDGGSNKCKVCFGDKYPNSGETACEDVPSGSLKTNCSSYERFSNAPRCTACSGEFYLNTADYSCTADTNLDGCAVGTATYCTVCRGSENYWAYNSEDVGGNQASDCD